MTWFAFLLGFWAIAGWIQDRADKADTQNRDKVYVMPNGRVARLSELTDAELDQAIRELNK